MRDAEVAYREARPLVLGMARLAGFNEVEQREIAQRVGIVLVEKADEYDPSKGTPRMWAIGIARNILLDARRAARLERRRADRSGALNRIPSPLLTPEETLRARESLILSREGVREEHRVVFDLDAQGCTTIEIAEVLGASTAHVDWRLREARKDLDRTLVTLGETRREITRVRDAFFFGLGFEAFFTWKGSSEPAAAGETSAPEVREPLPGTTSGTASPRWRSRATSGRQGASRVWAAVQSASPWTMAAVVVLAVGAILGAASEAGGLPAARQQASAVRRDACEPGAEVGCSAPAGAPREEHGRRVGVAVSGDGRTPAPAILVEGAAPGSGRRPASASVQRRAVALARSPAIAAARYQAAAFARRREWLVVRTLLGLRRDAEVSGPRGGAGGRDPLFERGFQ